MSPGFSEIKNVVYSNSPCFFQNIFCSIEGYQRNRMRFTNEFDDFCKLLKRQEYYNHEQYVRYQQDELKKLMEHCYTNVPYYRNLFNQLGIDDKSISIDNLHTLPILTKEQVKEKTEEFIAGNYDRKSLISFHTSGTTGSALKLYRSRESIQREYAVVWARGRDLSLRNQPYLSFTGTNVVPLKQKKPPFYRFNYTGNQVLFSQYHMNDSNMSSYIDFINKFDYKYIQGYPSIIYVLANYIYENNIKLLKKPQAIYTSSESLLEKQRDLIEKVFECKIVDYYGTIELTSILTQCEEGNYHINYECGITEFLPMEKVGELTRCEIVSTSFLNAAFPLVRYKVNDFVLLDNNVKVCECGRIGPVVKVIEGRLNNGIIITPEGNKIGRLGAIFRYMVNIKESQIVQEDLYNITIKVVKGGNYSREDERLLTEAFYERVPRSINMKIEYVDYIERTKSGKFIAQISKVKV